MILILLLLVEKFLIKHFPVQYLKRNVFMTNRLCIRKLSVVSVVANDDSEMPNVYTFACTDEDIDTLGVL